jgi:glycosyltransferase involved in cell wall biosynthesis
MAGECAMSDVSVIIAVKNGERFIEEAIRSALAQNGSVGQIIVVDDGSEDRTISVVEAMNEDVVRVVASCASGVSSARNYGASLSSGEWLLFLDADDRLVPGSIEKMIAVARRSGGAAMVYGDYGRIHFDGSVAGGGWKGALSRRFLDRSRVKPSGRILGQLIKGNFIINGGVAIVRRDVFERLGGFHPELALCEDWRLWCQIAAEGDVIHAPVKVMDYRLHTGSVMMTRVRQFAEFKPALDMIFDDLRAAGRAESADLKKFRKQAENSLKAYCVAQAARGGKIVEALRVGFDAIWLYPRGGATVILRLIGALSGL